MAKLFAQTLRQGSTGRAVNFIAWVLKGGDFDPDDEIALDGTYTPDGKIAMAVKAFQKASGLEPTGDVDAETLAHLSDNTDFDLDELTEEMFATPTVYAPAQVHAIDEAMQVGLDRPSAG